MEMLQDPLLQLGQRSRAYMQSIEFLSASTVSRLWHCREVYILKEDEGIGADVNDAYGPRSHESRLSKRDLPTAHRRAPIAESTT
jgi:hypothetical protein